MGEERATSPPTPRRKKPVDGPSAAGLVLAVVAVIVTLWALARTLREPAEATTGGTAEAPASPRSPSSPSGLERAEPPQGEGGRQAFGEPPPERALLAVRVVRADGAPAAGVAVWAEGVFETTSAEGLASLEREELLEHVFDAYFVVEAADETSHGTTLTPLDAREVTVRLERAPFPAVHGLVIDERTRVPLAGLTVRSRSTRARTDEQGRFTFPARDDPYEELFVERDSRVLHYQQRVLAEDVVIEVVEPLAITLVLSVPRPESGTVTLHAGFGEREIPVEQQAIESRPSITFQEVPAGADKLIAAFACPGYAPCRVEVVPGVENSIALTPVTPLIVRTHPPPPGGRVEVIAQVLDPTLRPPNLQERVALSASGEAVFESLPTFGTANLCLESVPRAGHGRVRILACQVDLAERLLDLSEVELHSVHFVPPASSSGEPFALTLKLLDSHGSPVTTRWLGPGTSYGATRLSRLTSDARGRLELTLPDCELEAEARAVAGAIGRCRRRVDADAMVELVAEKRVAVDFRLVSAGLPVPGRRIRLETSAKDGIRETFEILTDAEGMARALLARQAYAYFAEGEHGVVEGARGRIEVAGPIRIDCELPSPAHLRLIQDDPRASLIAIRLAGERALHPRGDGLYRDLVYSTWLRGTTTIQLAPGAYVCTHGIENGDPVSVELHLGPGEWQELTL